MAKSLGIHLTGRITSGVVEEKGECPQMFHFPESAEEADVLLNMPLDELIDRVTQQAVRTIAACGSVDGIGVALPGIVREGVVMDSPNLVQLKGIRMAARMHKAFVAAGIAAPIQVLNDADAMAAGVAAKQDRLDHFIRLWTLGYGVGFGRHPYTPGIWEGGHCVVSLDSSENYCGCGGRGHLEGIMGHRAMRLRFLDMEPEEVFATAKKGDKRCSEFVRLWHRSLAAATANSIHMEGPGRFYYTGVNVRFLDMQRLQHYLQQMVKMSPLQSYSLEVIPMSDDLAVIGSAIAATRTASR